MSDFKALQRLSTGVSRLRPAKDQLATGLGGLRDRFERSNHDGLDILPIGYHQEKTKPSHPRRSPTSHLLLEFTLKALKSP